jgi:CheY-like chemotaxis protein
MHMIRPCFLVLDPEHPGSISTRKLVIETAKFNVITAYSGTEVLETLARFPALDGAVLDARVLDMPVATLIERMRKLKDQIPIVVIGAPGIPAPEQANYLVESLSPRSLLDVLQKICPGETEAIEQHDRELEADGQ